MFVMKSAFNDNRFNLGIHLLNCEKTLYQIIYFSYKKNECFLYNLKS